MVIDQRTWTLRSCRRAGDEMEKAATLGAGASQPCTSTPARRGSWTGITQPLAHRRSPRGSLTTAQLAVADSAAGTDAVAARAHAVRVVATSERLRHLVAGYAIAVVFGALFSRCSSRMRWPTRLGPKGLALYIAFNTRMLFAVRQWVIPFFKENAERSARIRADLTQALGREPTAEEFGVGSASSRSSRPHRIVIAPRFRLPISPSDPHVARCRARSAASTPPHRRRRQPE
jgi:hypothetical protein